MKTNEDLKKVRDKAIIEMSLRNSNVRFEIIVGMGTSGIAKGAKDLMKALLTDISERNISDVVVKQCGESGALENEPVIWVLEKGKDCITYDNMNIEKAKKIVVEHLINGKPVQEYIATKK